jgi:hypothetical protein
MEKETLEEAAERYGNKKGHIPTTELEDAIFKQGFTDGANWQAEKSYSEEEMYSALQKLRLVFKSGVQKWQEDFEFDLDKWFEQFKKR